MKQKKNNVVIIGGGIMESFGSCFGIEMDSKFLLLIDKRKENFFQV